MKKSPGPISGGFGFTKVRYRGLAKNLHRLHTSCALANLRTAGKYMLQGPAQRYA